MGDHRDPFEDGRLVDLGGIEQLQVEQAAHAGGIVELAGSEGRPHLLDALHALVVGFLGHQPAGCHEDQPGYPMWLVEGHLQGDGAAQ
ncbi:hypothetical protein D9M73_255510 [compost metagenome]